MTSSRNHASALQANREAWAKRIRHLVAQTRFDEAVELAEASQAQWFGKDIHDHWKCEVYQAKARHWLEKANKARADGQEAQEREALREAWTAADAAGDEDFGLDIGRRLHAPPAPPSVLAELDQQIEKGDWPAVLKTSTEALRKHPGRPEILGRRNLAVRRLERWIQDALKTEGWKEAEQKAQRLLKYRAQHPNAGCWVTEARQGRGRELLRLGWQALSRNDLKEAKESVDAARSLMPDSKEVRDLGDQIARAEASVDTAEQEYRKALAAARKAQREGTPRQAMGPIRVLFRLRRSDPATCTTMEELAPALEGAWEDALRGGDPNEKIKVESEVEEFLRFANHCREAAKRIQAWQGRSDVRNDLKRYWKDKRDQCDKALEGIVEHLTEHKWVEALEACLKLEEWNDESRKGTLAELKSEATTRIRKRLTLYGPLVNGEDEDTTEQRQVYLKVYSKADPESAHKLQLAWEEDLKQDRARREERAKNSEERIRLERAKKDLTEIQEAVEQQRNSVVAFRVLDEELQKRLRNAGPVVQLHKAELRQLRDELRKQFSRWRVIQLWRPSIRLYSLLRKGKKR